MNDSQHPRHPGSNLCARSGTVESSIAISAGSNRITRVAFDARGYTSDKD